MGSLAIAMALLVERPASVCAQRSVPGIGPIEVILDASGSMRGSFGDTEKMSAARTFLRTFRRALEDDGAPPRLALRVYGADSHRATRDCRDTRLVLEPDTSPVRWSRALERIEPLGVSPLAYALERAAKDTLTTYVLISDGGDNCGGDPCATWKSTSRVAGDRRPRIHVVAVGADRQAVEALRCISRAGSGWFSALGSPEEVEPAARRLARILENRGLLDVRLSVGDDPLRVPVRVSRPLTGEVVSRFTSGEPHEVPAGIYSVSAATSPPVTIERVLVLPGETAVVERGEFGRVVVDLGGASDDRAPVTVHGFPGDGAVRSAVTGEPFVLGAGEYRVAVALGDSVVTRVIEVSQGETERVVVGAEGGTLVVLAPGFVTPPDTRALLYGGAGVDTLDVGEVASLSAGHYRLVVRTLPPYVSENVWVEADRETVVTLPAIGSLGVELIGADGPIRGVRAEIRQPLTGEAYGAIPTGSRRLLMPGRYRVEFETVPPRAVDDVVVTPGAERTVTLRGVSRLEVGTRPPGGPPVRLEVRDSVGVRRLGEATGHRPSLVVWPGIYRVRLWQGTDVLWEGRSAVAAGETSRIDWPGQDREGTQPGEAPR